MSEGNGLSPEEETFQEFLAWMAMGRQIKAKFDAHGFQQPAALSGALGSGHAQASPKFVRISPPARPESPPNAQIDWIWIPANRAMVRTVVLAILNEGKIITIKALINRVKNILPRSSAGTVYNIGAQLTGKIEKGDNGWSLKKGELAPYLHKGNIWAPKELLQNQDLAESRRMAIYHLLGIKTKLQLMEIFRELKDGADWLQSPLSKDLVKDDLKVMEKDNLVRQMGRSKRWARVDDK
ncbi:MAG: hypothetical protein WC881_03280 [Elusimicrobiota bacterium]|jgi:hypothetical protein